MAASKPGMLLVPIKRKKTSRAKVVTRGGGSDGTSSASSLPKQSRRGIFSALQRALWRRRAPSKPSADTSVESAPDVSSVRGVPRGGSPLVVNPTKSALPSASPFVFLPSTSIVNTTNHDEVAASTSSASSAPHRPADEEEEEYEDDGEEADDAGNGQDAANPKRHKYSRWVPKLLVPTEKIRDRIHTKKKAKKRDASALLHPPKLFTVVNVLNMELLARIMAFLAPGEPGLRCASVNRTLAAGVRAYYELYCAHPRPHAFLVHRALLPSTGAGFLPRILSWLPICDRIRAGRTCRGFLECSDSMRLEITSELQAQLFLSVIGNNKTRVEARFSATSALQLANVTAESASRVLLLMDTGDIECFPVVLFTDRVSSRLQSLRVEGVDMEDAQFKQFAQLLHDREFRALRRLTLSKLSFPSRFMRDWARAFVLDRFQSLEYLDIIDVGLGDEDMRRFFSSLRLAPRLSSLAFSHNAVSFDTMTEFVGHLQTKEYLPMLSQLVCEAVTADPSATQALVDVLMRVDDLRPLCSINMSANPLGVVQRVPDRTPRSQWRLLTRLNLASMHLGEYAFCSVLDAFCPTQDAESSAIEHLDVSNNDIGAAADMLARVLTSRRFCSIRTLCLAGNGMQPLDIEAITAALSSNCCPLLEELDLSGNLAGGEGASRFCSFLRSRAARRLFSLDLSDNTIPHRGQMHIAEALRSGACRTLHHLNLSRNPKPATLVPFQEVIRSGACPSLVSLQISYAQTFADGQALVRAVRSRISVDELRRLKQERFEARLRALQAANNQRAVEERARGKRQARALRERYDRLEGEADRALRRRKLIRKSVHLLIHQEIDRQLREREHHARVRALADHT